MRSFQITFSGPIMLVSLFLVASYAKAGPPDFSGHWALDPSKSEDIHGAVIDLTIQQTSGTIIYQRVVREKDGKQIKAGFTCPPDGRSCEFDENGRKEDVSLWYDSSALIMARTGGPAKDATTERRFELSPDGKILTVEFTNFSSTGKPQKLVFTKQ